MKIYICVYGGIVSNVYAETAPETPEPEAIVLDVDKEREDAGPVQARWDGIAADAARFREIGTTFYDPLGGNRPD